MPDSTLRSTPGYAAPAQLAQAGERIAPPQGTGPAHATPMAVRRGDETAGMLLGLAAVAIFSLSLPATRLAVNEMNPVFAALGRAVAAALPAAAWLWMSGAARPRRQDWPGLALVMFGCVVGYPLFSSLAL